MNEQNRSSAVMQQRQAAEDELDDFPTPPWATRALIQKALLPTWGGGRDAFRPGQTALEPCCNRGFMAKPLREYLPTRATDVHDYGWPGMDATEDFLFPGADMGNPDWVFANPPFLLAEEFIAQGRALANVGVAVLVRTSFLEGEGRYKNLFSRTPPNLVCQYAERVIMHRGVLRDPAVKYWNPEGKDPVTKKRTGCWQKPSTATSYCWLVWIRDWIVRERILWIPPCRLQLEKPGDYPVWPELGAAPPPPTSALTGMVPE